MIFDLEDRKFMLDLILLGKYRRNDVQKRFNEPQTVRRVIDIAGKYGEDAMHDGVTELKEIIKDANDNGTD